MEQAILLGLQSIRIDGLTQIMALLSALGNKAFIWIVVGVVLLFFAETRETGVLVIVSLIIVFIVSEVILEPIIARPRPCDAGIGVEAVTGVSHNGFSFPSGHSTSSFAAAIVIAVCMGRRFGIPAIIVAALIAFSRLYLGVHYPSDVLAGALIGALIGFVVCIVYNNFFREMFHERLTSFRIGGSTVTPKRNGSSSRRSHQQSGSRRSPSPAPRNKPRR